MLKHRIVYVFTLLILLTSCKPGNLNSPSEINENQIKNNSEAIAKIDWSNKDISFEKLRNLSHSGTRLILNFIYGLALRMD